MNKAQENSKESHFLIKEVFNIKNNFDCLLVDFGIRSTGNRFDQAEKILEKAFASSNTKETVYIRHAISELYDLGVIISLYKNNVLNKEKLSKILPIIISGDFFKEFRKDPKPDPSRNVMFEISLLNYLHSNGFNVEYEEGDDVRLCHDGKKYAIECKRLRSISDNTVKSNLRRAYRQLDSVKDVVDYGIVALGIEEYVFAKDEILVVDSAISAKEATTQFNKDFINKYGKWWQITSFIKDKKYSPAVFVCMKSTIYDFKNNITGPGFFITANNTDYPATDSFKEILFLKDEKGWIT